jgi:hypothetical protein
VPFKPPFTRLTEFLAWLSLHQREGAKYNDKAEKALEKVKSIKATGKTVSAEDWKKLKDLKNLEDFLRRYLPPKKVQFIKEALEKEDKDVIPLEVQDEQTKPTPGDIVSKFEGYVIQW